MEKSEILYFDKLATELKVANIVEANNPSDAIGLLFLNKGTASVKIAARTRAGNLKITTPLTNQNPTLEADRGNFVKFCLKNPVQPNYLFSVNCQNTQPDIVFEIDKTETYLVAFEGEEFRTIKGSDLITYFKSKTNLEAYTDTDYPVYNSVIYCTPTDLAFMYNMQFATNSDTGMILQYQIDDTPIRTFVTSPNLDLPNVSTSNFMSLFIAELNSLNLGPKITSKTINLTTNVETSVNVSPYNFSVVKYSGNIGLLPLGQSTGTITGSESTSETADPVTIRFHMYKQATYNGVGIKGQNGNVVGYVDMYRQLFGTINDYVEVSACGLTGA